MTALALVGAGSGPGPATARRFDIALISPGQDRLDALTPDNIHAAQLIIPGAIRPDAERLHAIHTERGPFRHYAEPLPA